MITGHGASQVRLGGRDMVGALNSPRFNGPGGSSWNITNDCDKEMPTALMNGEHSDTIHRGQCSRQPFVMLNYVQQTCDSE
jgi:hypothetical protein